MLKEGLKPEEVAFMGDDIPDLPCLRYAGLPCAPFDAAWEAKRNSPVCIKVPGRIWMLPRHYRTDNESARQLAE